MIAPSTHASVLERARNLADPQAWLQLDRTYGPWILRYCRARGVQWCDAEDVRQSVLWSLARVVERFRYRPEIGRFRSYLGRCVRRALARQRRRGHLLHDAGTLLPHDAPHPGSEALWQREWVHHHFQCAMQRVRASTDRRSLAIFDDLLAGCDAAQVAARHDTTVPAVHKVKQRIRVRLRELIRVQIAAEDVHGTR
jgi:DNA-directed RNA polymerase specialized sigma24 family protein